MKLLLSNAKLSKCVVIVLMILGQSANIRQRPFIRYLILFIKDKTKALRIEIEQITFKCHLYKKICKNIWVQPRVII